MIQNTSSPQILNREICLWVELCVNLNDSIKYDHHTIRNVSYCLKVSSFFEVHLLEIKL